MGIRLYTKFLTFWILVEEKAYPFVLQYIGILLNFHLIQTSVTLVDDTSAAKCNVLGVQISELKAGISQRPAADAIRYFIPFIFHYYLPQIPSP